MQTFPKLNDAVRRPGFLRLAVERIFCFAALVWVQWVAWDAGLPVLLIVFPVIWGYFYGQLTVEQASRRSQEMKRRRGCG